MAIQYRAFHFCPRPDGKGLTITKGTILITIQDAIRQLTPNVDPKCFGFCFYPNDVKELLEPGYRNDCKWNKFYCSPLTNGAILTKADIDHWRFPGYCDPEDVLPNGRP